MRLAYALFAFVACTLLSAAAPATTGGPTTMKALGYDRRDSKVYLLEERWDEGEHLPQLYYMFAKGKHSGRLIRVCSWYRDVPAWLAHAACATAGRHTGSQQQVVERFEARLEMLRARLQPMPQGSPKDVVLRSQRLQLKPGKKTAGKRLRVTLHPRGKPKKTSRTIIRVYRTSPNDLHEALHVEKLWRIGPGSAAVAILRYVGIPYEGGYTKDAPVLIRL